MSNRKHRRSLRLALALMLTTSAAGIVASQPAFAQSENDYIRAFGFSDYTYCDAKLVGNVWSMTPYEGKIQIGMKIVGGFDENLGPLLSSARRQGYACEWADTGLSYDNAEDLAGVWGITTWDAKARAARMFTMGQSTRIRELLEPNDHDRSDEQTALDRFFASGYSYCDAQMIGTLYGTDAYRGKIEIGNKISNGLVANIPLVLNESRERGARCAWGDLPYGYSDAQRLAGAWGMDVPRAKAAASELASWGRNDVIAAALGN